MTIEKWESLGKYISIRNHKIFAIDTGGDSEALVVLHGYPSASIDYYKILELWKSDFRVIIHDHLGFGLSDKPRDYSYSLIEQADFALQLWQKLGVQKAHLLAHDYGTSVATEIIFSPR